MGIVDIIRVKLARFPMLKKILMPINDFIRNRKLKKLSKTFKMNADGVFLDMVKILQSANISFWPEFGTLLGIIRDGYFMPHDYDFDFGAFIEDKEKIIEVLTKNNYRLVQKYEAIGHPEILEITFSSKDILIDFFFFVKKKSYNCHVFNVSKIVRNKIEYGVKLFEFPPFELSSYSFLDVNIYIPDNVSDHLIVSYGEKYMIPDPNFKSLHTEYMPGITAKHYMY